MIRKAEKKDISRIAEILVFDKRMNYRSIFKNDDYSFHVLQVLDVAKEYAPFRLFILFSSSNCHSIASIFMTYSVVPASRRLCPEKEKPWAS